MIKIMLVDDHPVLRHGMTSLLSTQSDFEVVGDTGDHDQVLELAARLRPDLVLMDLDLGAEVGGVQLTGQLMKTEPGIRVLVFTTYDSDADIVGALDAGAVGYLLKESRPAELFDAIRSAVAGGTALSPSVAARMVGRLRTGSDALTSREIEVLELLGQGHSNRAIGRELFVSEATVKTHLHHIFTKLGVDSRAAALAEANRRGIIQLHRTS
ncbi:response regulator transcription factor [Microlunatus elymi]|uniref:Response regulator transcription factor n=1 Tax=Microlunatus elymi TaxID=2596828 RepID=A0A516PY08_9ACTN|nr:response regulator transcription factor [Microlunatus elymi]QDP96053.1 response regulator transcription factor [Microlunatus elymi]